MLEGVTITNGYHTTGPAVVTYEGATLDVAHCVFTNNTATTHGGAVANFAGFVTYTDCVFNGNAALQGGAAADPSCGAMDFTSCVFADNTAAIEGGAIFINDISQSTWTDCTIVGNASPVGSGAFIEASIDGPIMIWNTIIADNTGGAAVVWDGLGVLFLNCSDLFGNEGGDWVGGIAVQGGINNNFSADPVFCDGVPGADPYGLDVSSPCSSALSTCGGVGARGVVCDGMVGNEDEPTPEAASKLALHPCRPNPFNPATVISFELEEPGTVTLQIVDVRGRHIDDLMHQTMQAGTHTTTWLGRDAAGELVPAGIYFAKLVVGDIVLSQRMTLLK